MTAGVSPFIHGTPIEQRKAQWPWPSAAPHTHTHALAIPIRARALGAAIGRGGVRTGQWRLAGGGGREGERRCTVLILHYCIIA